MMGRTGFALLERIVFVCDGPELSASGGSRIEHALRPRYSAQGLMMIVFACGAEARCAGL